jgi:hypothetical protein
MVPVPSPCLDERPIREKTVIDEPAEVKIARAYKALTAERDENDAPRWWITQQPVQPAIGLIAYLLSDEGALKLLLSAYLANGLQDKPFSEF